MPTPDNLRNEIAAAIRLHMSYTRRNYDEIADAVMPVVEAALLDRSDQIAEDNAKFLDDLVRRYEAAITEARREGHAAGLREAGAATAPDGWLRGFALWCENRAERAARPGSYAAGEHDTPAGEPAAHEFDPAESGSEHCGHPVDGPLPCWEPADHPIHLTDPSPCGADTGVPARGHRKEDGTNRGPSGEPTSRPHGEDPTATYADLGGPHQWRKRMGSSALDYTLCRICLEPADHPVHQPAQNPVTPPAEAGAVTWHKPDCDNPGCPGCGASLVRPAQNPVTPMVVGADGRGVLADDCACGHTRNWHVNPKYECDVSGCLCATFTKPVKLPPPAQQPAGPDVDTAAIRKEPAVVADPQWRGARIVGHIAGGGGLMRWIVEQKDGRQYRVEARLYDKTDPPSPGANA